MSDTGEKTEEPTEKKIKDARKKGDAPQTTNIIAALLLITGTVLMVSFLNTLATGIMGLIKISVDSATTPFTLTLSKLEDALWNFLFGAPAFIIIGMAVLTALAGFTLAEFKFAPESLKPKFEKFNPVNGAKQIFSLIKLYQFLNNIVFVFVATTIAGTLAYLNFANNINAIRCGAHCYLELYENLFLVVTASICIYLAVMAFFDFKIQNFLFKRQQKMTKDEVKREHKEDSGDPTIVAKRREIAQETIYGMGFKDITHAVQSQSVVVGFVYRKKDFPNPMVVIKTVQPNVAATVRRLRRQGTPVINLPEIAQKIAKNSKIGEFIARSLYDEATKVIVEAEKQTENRQG